MSDSITGLALKAASAGKGLYKHGKNAVLNTSEIVVKVKEATNSEAWGPSGTAMGEICDLVSSSPEERAQALAMIWERLREAPERWRKVELVPVSSRDADPGCQVYKALTLLEYLCKNASRRHEDYELRKERLTRFIEAQSGKDQGINVREKSKSLIELLKNQEKLTEQREAAKRSKARHDDNFNANGSSSDMGDEDWGKRLSPRHRATSNSKPTTFNDDDDDWGPDPHTTRAENKSFNVQIKSTDHRTEKEFSSPTPQITPPKPAAPVPRAPAAQAKAATPVDLLDLSVPDPQPSINQQRKAGDMDDLFSVPAMSFASPQKSLNTSFQDWNPFDGSNNVPSSGFQGTASGTANAGWVGFEEVDKGFDSSQPLQPQPNQWIQFNETGPNDLLNLGGNPAPVHQDLLFNPHSASGGDLFSDNGFQNDLVSLNGFPSQPSGIAATNSQAVKSNVTKQTLTSLVNLENLDVSAKEAQQKAGTLSRSFPL
eukprot:655496-Hanusia_phi.AAC.3